ncbi:hypothetical protein TNCT_331171 [Trichonephila clavata]|uniref:Uncharacterized protein n=1 Tax=Trichonephila clavata TaxID=2740835 RepID=A0A8X6JAM4_TRICU|nr:hypothetical protein TNCT_331171 [Trichonephila clavata]
MKLCNGFNIRDRQNLFHIGLRPHEVILANPYGRKLKTFYCICYSFRTLSVERPTFWNEECGKYFQKSMDQVLNPHQRYCRSYIDDVAVFSETWSDHMQHPKKMFLRL